MLTTRRVVSAAVVTSVLFLAATFAGGLRSQQDPLQGPANPSPLYVATFIDLIPTNIELGTAAIKQYVLETRKDPGNRRCEAVAQIAGRANHLLVIEVWQDEPAFQKHEAAAHTRKFRAEMQPLLGAPFDQREHFLIQ